MTVRLRFLVDAQKRVASLLFDEFDVMLGKIIIDLGHGISVNKQRNRLSRNLIPYWELDEIPRKSVSLFINTDSMPEIDNDLAEHYIELIKEKASDAFLSINQETQADSHGVVQDLVEKAGGFRRVYRFPHWMLRGYVEELYKIVATTPVSTRSDHRWWQSAR